MQVDEILIGNVLVNLSSAFSLDSVSRVVVQLGPLTFRPVSTEYCNYCTCKVDAVPRANSSPTPCTAFGSSSALPVYRITTVEEISLLIHRHPDKSADPTPTLVSKDLTVLVAPFIDHLLS